MGKKAAKKREEARRRERQRLLDEAAAKPPPPARGTAFYWTVGGLLVAVVAAIGTWLQWGCPRKPPRDVEKDRPRVAFLGIQRASASHVDETRLPPKPGLRLAASIKNTGPRTAYGVASKADWLIAPFCDPTKTPNPCNPKAPADVMSISIPGTRTDLVNEGIEWITLQVMEYPKEYEDGVCKGEMTLFVYGYITYRDEWQDPHWTTFCQLWSPKSVPEGVSPWVFCDSHNEMDKATTNP